MRTVRCAATILVSLLSLLLVVIVALNPPNNSRPAWSPNGKQIAFEALTHFHIYRQIYLINTDGSGLTRLTSGLTNHTNPVWSPDGKQIAFWRERKKPWRERKEPTREDIYMIQVDGKRLTRLTDDDPDGSATSNPSWSPDSKRIIFTYYKRQNRKREIYSIDTNTKRLKSMTENHVFTKKLARYNFPSWSPDGKKIAFDALKEKDIYKKIYTMNADGSGHIKELESGYLPVWSPDGKRIAFLFKNQILSLELDSLELTKLAQIYGSSFVDKPVWSPDGQKLAFVAVTRSLSNFSSSMAIFDGEIYLVNTNNSGGMKHIATGFNPTWSPDSKQIAFRSNGSIYIIDTTTFKSRRLVAGDDWDIARL